MTTLTLEVTPVGLRANCKWLCFTPSTSIDVAYKKFTERYGVPPAEHFEEYHILWVGPVPDKEVECETSTPED